MNQIKLSNGNKRIGKDTLILNITSATDCPSKRAGLCKVCKICYAMKAERIYPQVLPYRREQAKYWDHTEAVKIAEDIITEARRKKKNRIRYLRVSEAGDLRGQEDISKLSTIADILRNHGIAVYTYTARRDLDFSGVSENLTVNGSSFTVHNSFTAVKEYSRTGLRCAGNCRDCNLCKARRNASIEVLNH